MQNRQWICQVIVYMAEITVSISLSQSQVSCWCCCVDWYPPVPCSSCWRWVAVWDTTMNYLWELGIRVVEHLVACVIQTTFLHNLWPSYYTHTHTHTHTHTVAGFSYFQFYCFQDTTALFNQFDPNSTTLFQFINRTDLQSVTARFCSETEVLREFIDSQLPWFQYQEWTWLGIGKHNSVCILLQLEHVRIYYNFNDIHSTTCQLKWAWLLLPIE